MQAYEYVLPTTGALFYPVNFQGEGHDSELVASANNYRAQLRDVLKTLKRSNNKETSTVIRTIEDYLPHLFNLYHASSQGSSLNTERLSDEHRSHGCQALVFSWRATFCDNKLPGKAFQRMEFQGIIFELNFVLLTYGYALSNYAHAVQGDNQRAVKLLTQAAGIFNYINRQVAPQLAQSGNRSCPELFPEFSSSLANASLGEAHLLAIGQMQEKTSFSVLCRVANGASDRFAQAIGVISALPLLKQLPNEFRAYLSKRRDYALSQAYRYLGQEHAKSGNVGFAIACVQQAQDLLKDEKGQELLRSLVRENQKIAFQVIASKEEVQTKLPSGRELVKATDFIEPDNRTHLRSDSARYAGDAGYY